MRVRLLEEKRNTQHETKMIHSYPHVYLSPHYDDAALSCGGTIHRQTQAGQSVLGVTIYAASPLPNEPFSAFAQSMHADWGNPADVIATRQAEDQEAMAILGADYLRLNFSDGIYRGHPQRGEWYYNNDDELFGQVNPHDMLLAGKIVEAIVELVPAGAEAILYAPLGVGHHVDHQLAHAAAWQLRQQGWNVAFYEDYPYADPHARFAAQGREYATLAATLATRQKANLQPQLRFFSKENLQAKIKSVRAYASQVPVLFGSEVDMVNCVRNYALRVGEGRLAERVWLPG